MDQAHLKKLLIDVGAKNVAEYSHNKHFQISCLLAPWTHKKSDGRTSEDTSPSCSISYKEEVALAHCFAASCGFGGSFVRYLETYNQFRNGEITTIVENARYLERGDLVAKVDACSKKNEHGVSKNKAVEEMLEVWPETELASLERRLKGALIKKKGIDVEIAKNYLLWDASANRIAIPVRRWDGRLVGIVERCWCTLCQNGQKCAHKYKNAINFVKSRYLFNEYLIDKSDGKKPIFVVEGIFDVLKMITAGFKSTVAIFGTSLSDDQARRLKSLNRPIVLMFDGDADGRKCTMEGIKKLHGKVTRLYECVLPESKDPGDLPVEELKKFANSPKTVF